MIRRIALLGVTGLMFVAGAVFGQTPASPGPDVAATPAAPAATTPPVAQVAAPESGLAAVYSDKLSGHKTASGQHYDPSKLTAAHKTLPFGTKVKVTNAKNGKSVVVRINDRGPRQADRVLDLSPRAAHALGIRKLGMAQVTLEVQH